MEISFTGLRREQLSASRPSPRLACDSSFHDPQLRALQSFNLKTLATQVVERFPSKAVSLAASKRLEQALDAKRDFPAYLERRMTEDGADPANVEREVARARRKLDRWGRALMEAADG